MLLNFDLKMPSYGSTEPVNLNFVCAVLYDREM